MDHTLVPLSELWNIPSYREEDTVLERQQIRHPAGLSWIQVRAK